MVDDYEMVPEILQRRIEDIAESSGATAKVIFVGDEVTEEDKEMNDLMKKVYERVFLCEPDRRSQERPIRKRKR